MFKVQSHVVPNLPFFLSPAGTVARGSWLPVTSWVEVTPIPLRTCLLILERGEGRGREGRKHTWEGKTSSGCLLFTPHLGTELAT